jgi:hypothetical protein
MESRCIDGVANYTDFSAAAVLPTARGIGVEMGRVEGAKAEGIPVEGGMVATGAEEMEPLFPCVIPASCCVDDGGLCAIVDASGVIGVGTDTGRL